MGLGDALRNGHDGKMGLQDRKADPARAARARVERLDWDLVRGFLAVAATGRLAAAAPRLGADVSTVSRRIERLEAELGVPLFERGATGMTLTAAGARAGAGGRGDGPRRWASSGWPWRRSRPRRPASCA
jgi:hypothetical protein